MSKLLLFFVVFALISATLVASQRPRKRKPKRNDVPKRIIAMKTESTINVQFVRTKSVEIGFDFIQGAEGFIVAAKEWIDGKFEQTVETYRQILDVQRRSAVLRNLIPGREYLIQVQALNKNQRPFGAIQEKVVRTAQECFVCNGVETNGECSARRDTIECPYDKDACLTVVRFDNDKMSITKRCAQYDPLLVERKPSDACMGRESPSGKDSVCRCMCRSNLCNKLALPCVDECIDELPIPIRATVKCTNDKKIGSVCKWECATGYMVKGLKDSKCRKDRTWSVMSPPQCVPKPTSRTTRPPPRTAVKTRSCKPVSQDLGVEFECTDESKHNSICTTVCKNGFTMESGSTTRVCRNGKWTGISIVCKEILCPSVASTAGFMNCSDSTKIGSVCNFATPTTMTCKNDGSWVKSGECSDTGVALYDIKSITPDTCEALSIPPYGNIKCSDELNLGSVCKYTCANGYRMIGENQLRRCEKGQWTGSPVTCEEVKCGDVSSLSFVNSVLKCSDDDRIGSVCDIITPSQVTCQADGKWTMPFKHAEKCKECKCP